MKSNKVGKRPFAKRSLGQNFLVDEGVIQRIISALGNISNTHVIEIGPGRGALTSHLAATAEALTCIELDRDFAAALSREYQDRPGFSVIEGDVLDIDLCAISRGKLLENVRVVGNLPYNISTPVISKLGEARECFDFAVLMLQKEVVERISAEPGRKARGYLSVITQAMFEVESLFDVGPRSFKPVPRVTSSVVRLTPRPKDGSQIPADFKRLVSAGFSQKRKTLRNNLKHLLGSELATELLRECDIEENRRAETLAVSEWISLATAYGAIAS